MRKLIYCMRIRQLQKSPGKKIQSQFIAINIRKSVHFTFHFSKCFCSKQASNQKRKTKNLREKGSSI